MVGLRLRKRTHEFGYAALQVRCKFAQRQRLFGQAVGNGHEQADVLRGASYLAQIAYRGMVGAAPGQVTRATHERVDRPVAIPLRAASHDCQPLLLGAELATRDNRQAEALTDQIRPHCFHLASDLQEIEQRVRHGFVVMWRREFKR